MKKIFTILTCAVGMVILANTESFAQASATAASSATLVSPIAITKQADLAFGNFASNGSAGTLSLAATAAGTRTAGTGVTLPATTGTFNAARFKVDGQTGYTFSESFSPATVVLTIGTGTTNNMTLTPVLDAATGTLTGGTALIYLGGSLAVNSGQNPGSYATAAGALTVTVNYN